jgi:hypothetical protein
MRLHHRFSSEPRLELRLDYGSADGRTIQDRCYLWFDSLEDGRLRTRMKAMPQLSVDEAMWLIGNTLEYLLGFSGQEDAVERIHEFLQGAALTFAPIKGGRARNHLPMPVAGVSDR